MGYRVNKRKKKDGTDYWRVIYERRLNGGGKSHKHIPKDQLMQHGFLLSMTLEEAKARAKQLNAQDRLERRKVRALASLKHRQTVESAYLPPSLVAEFTSYLRKRVDIGPRGPDKWAKAQYHWAFVQKLVAAVELPPSQWDEEAPVIYNYLIQRQVSRYYVSKVLSVLNLWGRFLARKTGQSFIPVEFPKGAYLSYLVDAYTDSGKKKKESARLTPAMLEAAKEKLKLEHYNWLVLSVWFGLRPSEVDGLHNKDRWRVETDAGTGVPVLWVYQAKLAGAGVEREKRWKVIPAFLPEQVAALGLIGQHARPTVFIVQQAVAPTVGLYGGRKNFETLMAARGQDLKEISKWLGHKSIRTTSEAYMDHYSISFKPTK